MKANPETEKAVLNVLDTLNEVYAQKNASLLDAILSPDTDAVMLDVGAGMTYVGPQSIKSVVQESFAGFESSLTTWETTSVSASGPVAWVLAEGRTEMRFNGENSTWPMRLTAVLENRNGRWLLAQSHFSMPYPDIQPYSDSQQGPDMLTTQDEMVTS